jgi:hypothetical protein
MSFLSIIEAAGPTTGPCGTFDIHWITVWIFIATLAHARGVVLLVREAVLLVTRLLNRQPK